MNRPISLPTNRRPTPPGEILVREFLAPLGITQKAFARHIGIMPARLSEIVSGKRAVSIDTAMRFHRALGVSVESWLRMQLAVDMYDARHGQTAMAVSRIKRLPRPPKDRNEPHCSPRI
jgi:antitoxin HigA-1